MPSLLLSGRKNVYTLKPEKCLQLKGLINIAGNRQIKAK
jgi:hypothetical protein